MFRNFAFIFNYLAHRIKIVKQKARLIIPRVITDHRLCGMP